MIINEFYIGEDATYGSDYSYIEHKIDMPYELKAGDRLFEVTYGFVPYIDCTIESVNEEGIVVIRDLLSERMELPWINERGQKLKVFPFFKFENGVTVKVFKNFLKRMPKQKTSDYFWDGPSNEPIKHPYMKFRLDLIKGYEKNFSNICDAQITLF